MTGLRLRRLLSRLSVFLVSSPKRRERTEATGAWLQHEHAQGMDLTAFKRSEANLAAFFGPTRELLYRSGPSRLTQGVAVR